MQSLLTSKAWGGGGGQLVDLTRLEDYCFNINKCTSNYVSYLTRFPQSIAAYS